MSNLVIRSRADSPELKKAACSIEQASWNDLGYLSFTKSHYELYGNLLEEYADLQMCLIDEELGYPVAVANCVPLKCSGPDDLPPEGWDWVVENAEKCRKNGGANMLGALAISVSAVHRSKGYARQMIQATLNLAEQRGFRGLVVPVRPTSKSKHPTVSIYDYVTWTDDSGRPYDPWLRSHLACGGRIVRPCERSMVVEEPVAFWESWTKKKFDCSGAYTVEGGLVPVEIDLERNVGRYAEPNVWMSYV